MKKIQNFINGEFVDALDGTWLDNYCPATGAVFAHIANSKAADVDRAVSAAAAAFPAWSKTPTEQRSKLLYRVADILESRLDEFAAAESQDQGKTVATARTVDIPRAISNFRYYAGHVLHTEEMATVLEGARAINFSVRKPYGVAGLISPWNLPLYLATWKIAPAIAMGNTCVIKPSELSPLTATMLGEVLNAAGIPPGVVNIVHGLGPNAGQAIIEHPKIPIISFTGGTVTGKRIAATAAPLMKKLSLELGGKNANIVFKDCDLDECIATTVRSSFANQGEICLCGSRILVERPIYDEFVRRLIEATQKFKAGDPSEPSSHMGALISADHLKKVLSYIDIAVKEGGKVECGGKRPDGLPDRCKDGYFLEPTIITGLSPAARCNTEEIFGPVVTIGAFDTEDEAVAIANSVEYGLSATVWCNDTRRANRVALELDTGYVWINCWLVRDLRMPFGGTKMSGIGREGGKYAMDFYTEVKTICSKY